MKVCPPLSPKEDLALLRAKYPEALLCTSPLPCDHRVIATTSAGWAKSWAGASNVERRRRRDTYVCAECRQAADERVRVAAVRRANLASNRAPGSGRRQGGPESENGLLHGFRPVGSDEASGTRINSGDQGEGLYDGAPPLAEQAQKQAPSEQGRHGLKGGRPRAHVSVRAAQAAAARAYRQRQKLEQAAANDAALAALSRASA
jgi:hypothetical protein